MNLSLRNLFISLNLLTVPVLAEELPGLDPSPVQEYVKGTQVGDSYPITISSNHGVSNLKPQSSDDGLTDTYTLTYKDASYISVHFSHFDLPPGCVFSISDNNNEQTYKMTGRGKLDLGTFWAHHVNGDTMELSLSCNSIEGKEQASFNIDEYAAGYPSLLNNQVNDNGDHPFERRNLRSRRTNNASNTNHSQRDSFLDTIKSQRDLSICGVDDRRDAICYKTSEPTIYNKARAVARLLINGRSVCTGWLVSESNLLFTNEHCIDSLSDVQNTDFEFMGEEPECTNNAGSGWGLSNRNWYGIYDGTALLKKSADWDYALIQLAGNPASQYGYLELDNRQADRYEEIYIPQHPAGRPKEIALSDTNYGNSGTCRVMGYGRGCAPTDMYYSCDTEGGSSGSPVLSRSTNKVVALHHCGGGCYANLGAPIFMFYHEISQYFTATSAPVPAPSAPAPTASNLDNYEFHPYMDSGGNDITNISGGVEAAAAACNANSDCKGFNSNGWLKHTIKAQSQWSRWTSDPSKGFYVKKGTVLMSTSPTTAPTITPAAPAIDNYDFFPYMDSGGNDITNVNVSGGIDAAAAACNANPDCKGFNSNGWLKHTIRDQSQWSRWTSDPTKGFYVKKGDAPTSTPPVPAPTPTASNLDNYDFYPYMDSGGNDIGNISGGVEAAATACDANSACKGFNSNGWIKHTIKAQSQWSRWTNDPAKGFYVKK